MATEITMPKLSDTMTDGRFIGWRKQLGERIERGDVIAEVETDKAVMELEAFISGVLVKTFASGGETVPVGTVLGLIGDAGELTADDKAPAKVAPLPITPVEETTAAPIQKPTSPPLSETAPTSSASKAVDLEKASPLVRRLAREMGVDLALVAGSGPDGRVLQQDLATFAAAHEAGASTSAPSGKRVETPTATTSTAESTPISQSGMRQAIATTVARSWQEIPHFTVTMEIDMRACQEIVRELRGSEDELGYNALVIKACGMALTRFPRLVPGGNSAGIHIGFAVALPDGLLVPVIRDCERITPSEIARAAARLAERARNGRLGQDELSGGLFTVSNLGMYDVDEFMALIMPGQNAILAVGAVIERPKVLDGNIVAAPLMRVTLSSDHRVVDGAYAAAFLSELRHLLEQPMRIFI